MGLLAAAGITSVKVHPLPRVALLSTGDELVELGAAPGPGQIVNSNFHLLAARLRESGCSIVSLGIARDEPEDLAARIAEGLEADMLISTGGVSVGDRDYVQEILIEHGFQLGFWRVGIKPGKPVLFGTARNTTVFGLPGNPAASAATFELFARPALRRLAGRRDPLPPRLRVTLTEDVSGGEKRQRFLWGALQEREGRYLFTPSPRQGSGQNRSIQGAQALLPVPGDSPEIAAGTEMEVLLLRLPPGGA
jgi:molybdopterin molybdotransferase